MATDETPQRQITKNCHYISRFLTKPWEGKERKLLYYDFQSESFDKSPSLTLFAEDQINSQEVETWLRDVIETPLGCVRPRLASGDPKALDDWKFFRAAVLMVWLQGTRYHSVVDEEVRQDMGALAAMPPAELDRLVVEIKNDLDLRLISTVSHGTKFAPLFVPSSGLFQFTFPDTGCISGHSIGIGLPLDLRCALVLMPADKAGRADLSLLPASIANYSIGTSQSRLVVLPPDLLGVMSEREAARVLIEQRQLADSLYADDQKLRQTVSGMFSTMGIGLATDRTGRIQRPQ